MFDVRIKLVKFTVNLRLKFMGEFPNKATQFSSENQPKNRRKGESIKTLLKRLLDTEINRLNPLTLEQEDMTANEAIAYSLINEAATGDVQAAKEIFDRVEGKSQTNIKMDADVTQTTIMVGFSDEIEEEAEQ